LLDFERTHKLTHEPKAALYYLYAQQSRCLERVLIVVDFGDGTSTMGSAGRAHRPRGTFRAAKRKSVSRLARRPTPHPLGPIWGQVERSGVVRSQQELRKPALEAMQFKTN
jgi:hypothetical protein